MSKKFLTIFTVIILIPFLLFAQNKKKAPLKINENVQVIENHVLSGGTPVTAQNYVAVDTMSNAYGPAIGVLNPVAYDPYSNLAIVVHRGNANTYALGSGELWYNYSTDSGGSWARSATSVQDSQTPNNLARYPSMALNNPTQSTDLADLLAHFSWPELNDNPVQFDWVGYAADLGIDGSDFAAIDTDPPQMSSQVPCWTSDTEAMMFWASDNQADASIRLWTTSDYTSVTVSDPDQWADTTFGSGGNITMGGVSYQGTQYYGVLGTFTPEAAGWNAPGGWEPGYSKSTDNGVTWSDFNIINWPTIAATSQYTELWDYIKNDAFISYQADINVDMNGYVHIVTGLTKIDSAVSSEFGDNALVEFFETAGGWDAKIISDDQQYLADSTFTQNDGTGLGQMGYSVYLATNEARNFFVAQWVTSGTPGDSACDVWMSYRAIDGDWSAPMNLTETAVMNENSSHLAPQLADDGNGKMTAFSMYSYEAGNTGFDISPTNPTVVYIAAVDIMTTSVSDELGQNFDFKLDQNYPNPFNPTTRINYTIPEVTQVSLKVYDILGNEITTLVNGVKNAGSYNVNFDASDLASGLYIYTLKAGSFTSSQKMMLLK